MKTQIMQLFSQYYLQGLVKGGELCLPPLLALQLADDLGNLGVGIMGVDGWRYTENGFVAQDLATDFYVGDEILRSNTAVEDSVLVVKEFITNHLAPTTIFVSFTLNIPYDDILDSH